MRIALVLLAACATQDVLRSEPLVRRATCSDRSVAIFGYPGDARACAIDVVNLGEGCYLAKQPRRLYECAASAPDGHVACVEDMAIPRDDVFGEDIARWNYRLRVPYVSRTNDYTPYRCRARLAAWEIANLPPPPRRALVLTFWNAGVPVPKAQLATRFDPITIGRTIGGMHTPAAQLCPGPEVTLSDRYPRDLELELANFLTTALRDAGVSPTKCQTLYFGVRFAAQ